MSLQGLIKEQYFLNRNCGIDVGSSEHMADFERFIYISLLMKDLKEEQKKLKNLT